MSGLLELQGITRTFAVPDSAPLRFSLRTTAPASCCGRPEWVIAIANAPSIAYDSAIFAPPDKPF